MVDIQLNNACRLDTRFVGNEKTPVITIDQPILSTGDLVRYACREAQFVADGKAAYPGIRAELPDEYVRAMVPQLVALISHTYNVPRAFEPHVIHRLYSLVTQKPEELGMLQRLPHTDNRSPWYFATVHYLSEREHAGTGFFRHRPTGYERITADRYQSYIDAAQAHMAAHGPPSEKYINDSDDHYELIDAVEHRPNSMAIYPGNLLHSGLIRPDRDIDADPATGRLTANLFLYFTGPDHAPAVQARR